MLMGAYIAALTLNVAFALLSRSRGLILLAALLAASFVSCEIIMAISDAYLRVSAPSLRVLAFAMVDFIYMSVCFCAIHVYRPMPRFWRLVFKASYVGMVGCHGAVLLLGHPAFWGYDQCLNTFFALQILSCLATSFSIVFLSHSGQNRCPTQL